MTDQGFVIARVPRGSLLHVRRRDSGECVGCIEAGLYEIVRAVVLGQETAARPTEGTIEWQQPSPAGKRSTGDARNDDER